MNDILKAIGVFILGVLVTWFWKHRDRVVKKEDDTTTGLAAALKTLELQTARQLEDDRKTRAAHLEEQQEKLVARIDQHDSMIASQLSEINVTIAALTTKVDLLWDSVRSKVTKP